MSTWADRAECRDTDREVFFNLHNVDNAATAKRLCGACPVRTECLNAAVAVRDFHGYRAGMTGEERRRHASKPSRVDTSAEMVRLHRKRWTPPAIGLRLGVDPAVVYRALKQHRESGEAA